MSMSMSLSLVVNPAGSLSAQRSEKYCLMSSWLISRSDAVGVVCIVTRSEAGTLCVFTFSNSLLHFLQWRWQAARLRWMQGRWQASRLRLPLAIRYSKQYNSADQRFRAPDIRGSDIDKERISPYLLQVILDLLDIYRR